MTAAAGADSERAAGFRPDIEGLRAIAVLLIVIYHAGVQSLTGGYIGVDVFFVISGFLITGLLVKELDATGRLDLLEFYARRVRRILPAAFLVLAVTLALSIVLLSPVGFAKVAPDIAAALAYVPNFLFAFQRTDYFHPGHVSPVIHYWSLGVEEQFYLLWPAFLWLAHRSVRGDRGRLTWIVGGVVALSFAVSLVATRLFPTAAFYLLPTRAWELGAGALIVLAGPSLPARLAPAVRFIGLVGLLLIAVGSVVYREATPFPGIAAVVPVLGAMLVIAGGAGPAPTWSRDALAWRPLRYVGRVSYSVYLWHWPLLVLAPVALPEVPVPVQAILAIALTFLLADATYRWVEDPMRQGRLIGRRPSRNLVAALATSAVLVAITLGTGRLVLRPFIQHPLPEDAIPLGVDPFISLLPLAGPVPDGPLPKDLNPPVLNLHRGRIENNPANGHCSLLGGETVNGPCTFGDSAATTKVVLFGDSHLAQWWPAIERIMVDQDWQVVMLVKTSCTYADVTAVSASGPKVECDVWREKTLTRIAAEQPDLVIVASNHRPPPLVDGVVLSGAAADAAMQAGAERTITRLQALGARVVVLADTPQPGFDPAECLTANPEHVARCAIPRDQALGVGWQAAERAAAERTGAGFVDVNQWACAADPCPMIIGHYAVFADTNHLTRPFVQGLTLRLEAALLP